MAGRRVIDPAYATTEDVLEAAGGINRGTLRRWIERGLIPKADIISQGYPKGIFSRFPAWVLLQARFIARKREEGMSLDEIAAMLEESGGFDPKKKPAGGARGR